MIDYRLRAVRLVNFHNFVDETVEVRDGGHLFLLGDNGSGKTTVLDAVHLVLAGGELELNAAARLGGRRDDGRSLQGIVLRYDFERGVRNAGGAIAYAAIELVADGDRHLTLGIGAEATTMDARVSRWGFVVPRPLAEVVLVDDEARPLDRDALRRQLGALHVFAPLAGYRKEVARRLFTGEPAYDEAVRFWGMAKAYREIVASSRDFGALFERLLPAPDGAVFDDILRTVRAIDDLEVALGELDGQRGYVAGLAARVHDVAAGREAAARCRWLAYHRERDEAAAGQARDEAAAATHRHEAARLRGEADAARLASERADETLRRAEADDAAGVLGAVRDAERRRRELAVDAARLREHADERRRERARQAAAAAATAARLGELARAAASELRAAAAAATELPGELAAAERLADELGPEGGDGLPAIDEAAAAAARASEARRQVAIEARVRAREATARRTACDDAVQALVAAGDGEPAPPDVAAARRALAAAGIRAVTAYEGLEPAPGASAATLAAIESLAGEALAALVVDEAERARACAVVAAAAPGVRVVVAGTATAPPPWCAAALAPSSSPVALAVLAAALAQPADQGEAPAPAGGDVRLRGLAHRVASGAPRLLGAEARRRAHAARLEAARAALAAAQADEAARAQAVARADEAVERARRVERAVAAVSSGPLPGAWHAAAAAAQRAALADEVWRDADARATAAAARLAGVDDELRALRGRVEGVDLDELERRLGQLRVAVERERAAARALDERAADARAAAHAAAERARASQGRRDELDALVVAATRDLRAAMAALGVDPLAGDDAALAHHVRVTLRGDSFRSLDTLRQRVADEARAADLAADELERDGSRGVRYLAHAGRFGFAYDRDRNLVEDRRGQPLAGVLAELDRTIAEQRSVITDRTRTLMDTLVMGELARQLQGQVHHLDTTVKGINRVLRGLRFGPSEYQFQVTPRPDRAELIELVRRLSILDEDSRVQFRAWIDARLDELHAADDGPPPLLDYRRWFEVKLRMSTTDAEGVELTHRLRQVGSGGEQGVPNYLLVLALAKLMFDAGGAAIRPLLFDEAFYGIDAGRRDQLLRLATDLGLQLLVASPDQDGVTEAVRAATTLFVVKDADHDVHLAPYHYWNRARDPQAELFAPPPATGEDATCRT